MHVLFQNEGDCIFIEIPEGNGNYKNILIDMGKRCSTTGKSGIPSLETGGLGALLKLKGQVNVFFPYIEEIVNAIGNSKSSLPQLNYTFMPFVQDPLIAGWVFKKETGTIKIY